MSHMSTRGLAKLAAKKPGCFDEGKQHEYPSQDLGAVCSNCGKTRSRSKTRRNARLAAVSADYDRAAAEPKARQEARRQAVDRAHAEATAREHARAGA